jgi:hypothetical protein
MTVFSYGEQHYVDDCIARRTDTFTKPPWMPSHRATRIKLHVRKVLATLPTELPGTDKVHYHADRRIVAYYYGRSAKLHEEGPDSLPICQMRSFFEEHADDDPAYGTTIEHLGAGPVTCGHCANTSGR